MMLNLQDVFVGDDQQNGSSFRVERTYLKDQVTQLLRDYLISGNIAAGTKLVERDIAEQLGISRAPARDALLQLEREGLIESRSNGRYVIEPTADEVTELYQVRLVLEKLAIELAIERRTSTDSTDSADLQKGLSAMAEAALSNDRLAFARADIQLHDLIWRQSGNASLHKTLTTMSGAIFLCAANYAGYYDLKEAYKLHEDLVLAINACEYQNALAGLERHIKATVQRLVGLYN
jgi:DNA-binding GntR family transcriptional regulator